MAHEAAIYRRPGHAALYSSRSDFDHGCRDAVAQEAKNDLKKAKLNTVNKETGSLRWAGFFKLS